jgi:hypothetical protein
VVFSESVGYIVGANLGERVDLGDREADAHDRTAAVGFPEA